MTWGETFRNQEKQTKQAKQVLLWILPSLFCCFLFKMSGVQSFQTYPPNEEPTESESEEESEGEVESSNFNARVRNIEGCLCGGNGAAND